MFSFLKSSPELPLSFDRWSEVAAIVDSENWGTGRYIRDIRTLKQWVGEYERWKGALEEFLKVERSILAGTGLADDFERRTYEHYPALLLQSGQWHAMLLTVLRDGSEEERSRYLNKIDSVLADLGGSIGREWRPTRGSRDDIISSN